MRAFLWILVLAWGIGLGAKLSHRTMVDTPIPLPLAKVSRLDWRCHHRQMKPTGMANTAAQ
jgi:hypothetical protein